ncbi:MAG: hypothetical protein AMJ61_10440 [Desulfobacterales bacterium SG8_35_2]|jgi:hypothetical protein|nr:MAG: hypothetical protein AMJ61_10440 [Desulfobacterales bacterium SG8_35_2]
MVGNMVSANQVLLEQKTILPSAFYNPIRNWRVYFFSLSKKIYFYRYSSAITCAKKQNLTYPDLTYESILTILGEKAIWAQVCSY